MSSYYITATQAIVSEAQLRAMFPNSILPSPLTAAALTAAGADPILETPSPTVTSTQTTSISGVVQDAQGNWGWNWIVTDMTTDQVTAALTALTTNLSAQIDNTVAGIYSNWTRFQAEYDARLAAAQAFQTANYAGDAGPWVDSYATAAGVSTTQAAQTIISQGANLTTALQALGGLRMQKYGILAATTIDAANAAYAALVTQINQAAAQIT